MKRLALAAFCVTGIILAEYLSPGFPLLAWQVTVEMLARSAVALTYPLALVGLAVLAYKFGRYIGWRDHSHEVNRAQAAEARRRGQVIDFPTGGDVA